MIKTTTLEQIHQRIDLVALAEKSGCQVTKSGKAYVCKCPIHAEKTPSLHISRERGAWHCFGCNQGGDAIAWVRQVEGKDFKEAVRYLCDITGAVYEEEQDTQRTAEDIEKARRKETLYALMGRVVAYYHDYLQRPEAEAISAKAEAVRRWKGNAPKGEEGRFVSERQIGYAPKQSNALIQWAKHTGESLEMLLELGLITERKGVVPATEGEPLYADNYRDTFISRLMLPICDHVGRPIGFTARHIGAVSEGYEPPKYINTRATVLYDKGAVLYGLHTALRVGREKGCIYIVEGAADVLAMQAVGIANVVAPCGTALATEQCQMIKRLGVPSVCLIGDADPPKGGAPWGAGVAAMLKNGEVALQAGLGVSVRELSLTDTGGKQDPADFFTSAKLLQALTEVDFVVWYAQKHLAVVENTDRRLAVASDVARLMLNYPDEVRVDMAISQLVKIQGSLNAKQWRSVLQSARGMQAKLRNEKATGHIGIDHYGLQVGEGGRNYWYHGKDGDLVSASNFVLKPLFHVKDNASPLRIFEAVNERGHTEIVALTPEELTSKQRFQQRMEGIGNYVWSGSEAVLLNLRRYLYDNTETAMRLHQMGYNAKGFFAMGNGIYMQGKFHKADDYGIVRLPEVGNYYLPSAAKQSVIEGDEGATFSSEKLFLHVRTTEVTMRQYLEEFRTVFGGNGCVGLAFWLTSLFHDVVMRTTGAFPLLNLFGPKGSGKTQLGQALMAFFIAENKAPNLNNATVPALGSATAFASGVLVHLDEYKNALPVQKVEFLKGIYDGVGRTRMSGAGFKEREMTAVRCGVMFSGQDMPTADIALMHRCVHLPFETSVFTREAQARFHALRERQRAGLTHLTFQVIDHRAAIDAAWPQAFDLAKEQLQNDLADRQGIETRILENWAKLLATVGVLAHHIALPFTYDELRALCIEGISRQNSLSQTSSEIADFWNTMAYLRSTGEFFEGADYKIQVKESECGCEWATPKRLLYIQKKQSQTLYSKYSEALTHKPALSVQTLKHYIEHSEGYIGEKRAHRFDNVVRGIVQHEGNLRKSITTSAYVFDYDLIAGIYDLSLSDTSDEHTTHDISTTP